MQPHWAPPSRRATKPGCYALHTVRTATGIDWDATDPRIASLVADFQSDDHILTLLEAIAVSDVFRTLDVAEETP